METNETFESLEAYLERKYELEYEDRWLEEHQDDPDPAEVEMMEDFEMEEAMLQERQLAEYDLQCEYAYDRYC